MTTHGTGSLRAAALRLRKSRIGLRVLAFNLLVLFLPVAGILYLDVYEERLLEMQERGMVEQARVVAAALARNENVHPDEARALLSGLRTEGDSRIRVFDVKGELVADSRRVVGAPAVPESYAAGAATGRDRILYRIGAWLARLERTAGERFRKLTGGDAADTPETSDDDIVPEVAKALKGHYGATTRPTPGQRSMTLFAAVPIVHGSGVAGAVMVSQSTFRILQALYALRLRIFEVVVASMIVAALLSALMSATIVRPLVRLRHAASSLADRRTPISGTFRVLDRRDEIGDLARALEELVVRLDAHIRLLESFSADVSHEFKNPLASIRTASEMLAAAEDPADRARFLGMLVKDVDRLERLVSGVRELARIDAQLAHEPATGVDLGVLLAEIVKGITDAGGHVTMAPQHAERFVVRGSRDRLFQVFENILDNARSFAPDGPIEIEVDRAGPVCRIAIADAGPGIPPAHLDRIFERFFTYRPGGGDARRKHTGLGLAIVKTIVEGYGGTITASNRPAGGAVFVVELPYAEL